MFRLLAGMGGENAMKLTMAILCVGGVIFLLRVLAALVKDSKNFPTSTKRAYLRSVTHPTSEASLSSCISSGPQN